MDATRSQPPGGDEYALTVKAEMNAKRNNNAHDAFSKRSADASLSSHLRISDDDDAVDGDASLSAKKHDKDGQPRKRKASLRKGILGKNMMRDRDNTQTLNGHSQRGASIQDHMTTTAGEDETRQFAGYEHASPNSSSDSGWPSWSSADGRGRGRHHDTRQHLASASRSSLGTYASTTDEDDATCYFRPSTSGNGTSYTSAVPLPMSPAMHMQRRRSNRSSTHSSPLMVQTPVDLTLDEEWDYSETEWWGWVILVVTWLVFVVGMGSCLDVWTWAWDVGETPYAPPELEDDPTLPITGYYPALMVCTVVMAWIWVVVAWVGMKYFRHAKVVADDG